MLVRSMGKINVYRRGRNIYVKVCIDMDEAALITGKAEIFKELIELIEEKFILKCKNVEAAKKLGLNKKALIMSILSNVV